MQECNCCKCELSTSRSAIYTYLHHECVFVDDGILLLSILGHCAYVLIHVCLWRLMGHYSGLKGGNISEGMEDFTGGIAYSQPVSAYTPSVIWRQLSAALSRGTLLSCFIQVAYYTQT